MNYPCNMIRDLLPLYLDEVCSSESREIVQKHLEQCEECKNYYDTMAQAGEAMECPCDAQAEYQKASSLRAVKKQMVRKQLMVVGGVLLLLAVICFGVVTLLKKTMQIVPYEENLSVSMVDGSLVGRLYGSEHTEVNIKRVTLQSAGKPTECLFYKVSDTKWNDWVTSDSVFSEYVLCPKDKSAHEIDKVYYYTGDYAGLEDLSDAELQAVLQEAELLWEKDRS